MRGLTMTLSSDVMTLLPKPVLVCCMRSIHEKQKQKKRKEKKERKKKKLISKLVLPVPKYYLLGRQRYYMYYICYASAIFFLPQTKTDHRVLRFFDKLFPFILSIILLCVV